MPIRLNLLAEAQAAEEARRRDPVKRAVWMAALIIVADPGLEQLPPAQGHPGPQRSQPPGRPDQLPHQRIPQRPGQSEQDRRHQAQARSAAAACPPIACSTAPSSTPSSKPPWMTSSCSACGSIRPTSASRGTKARTNDDNVLIPGKPPDEHREDPAHARRRRLLRQPRRPVEQVQGRARPPMPISSRCSSRPTASTSRTWPRRRSPLSPASAASSLPSNAATRRKRDELPQAPQRKAQSPDPGRPGHPDRRRGTLLRTDPAPEREPRPPGATKGRRRQEAPGRARRHPAAPTASRPSWTRPRPRSPRPKATSPPAISMPG